MGRLIVDSRTLLTVILLLCCFVSPVEGNPNCSEDEHTALFIVDNIYPGEDLQLRLLDVAPVGPITNPTIAEMIEAVEAVQPGQYTDYQLQAQAGPFNLFFAEPIDFGGSAIVDGRDGRVIFAGTVIWLGFGSVSYPVESSHTWSFPPGDPAAEPASTEILPNGAWSDQNGIPADITESVVDFLRGSDVLQSISDCGDYDVLSFIYTPIGNPGVDPSSASLIVIVSGQCGPPWSDPVSSVPTVFSDRWLTRVSPNPFNPVTVLSLDVPRESIVKVAIYSIDGKLVTVLADRNFASGRYSIPWSGIDMSGDSVSSGTYLARILTPNHSEVVPITLLK